MMKALPLLLIVAVVGCSCPPAALSSLDNASILVSASGTAVTDGRGRFREIYCTIRGHHGQFLPEDRPCEEALARLAGEEPPATGIPVPLEGRRLPLRVVVVPGIFGECIVQFVSPFTDALRHLETHGYRTGVIRVSGLSGSRNNAVQIRNAIQAMSLDAGERLVLVGYSKGAVDILTALTAYPDTNVRVAAVVSVAGPIGGSPIADSISDIFLSVLRHLDVTQCDPGDGRGIESLRRAERLRFLADSPLPKTVKYFSIGGIVDAKSVSTVLQPGYRQLTRIDPRNDGQVIFTDAVIPGGTLLGYVRADHWGIALPFSRNTPALAQAVVEHNAFPREVLLEAIVRMVEESM